MALDQWSSNTVPRGGPNYPRQDLLGEKGSRTLGVGLITQTSWPHFDPPIQCHSSRLTAVIILALQLNHEHI